jgi:hypothetical protein
VIRYHLDDLGWYQFEWLVQALLKDHLGVGVESWGGHGDHGRDAWCAGSLHFPNKHQKSRGPFLFQVKFVENANAAGARPLPRLLAAVKAEADQVADRSAKAKPPKHYVLLTNCVMSPKARREVESAMSDVLRGGVVHSLGGNDLCDLLDMNAGLRRSFPQLLSIRDLDTLLSNVVNRDIIERSSSAISHAKDLVPVFVPTDAYIRTWEVLKKHHFAVLDGPPEVGKSAIGWMVALTQVASGWEARVCDSPDDFFRAFRSDESQVFVADDAFGRTEYDPSRGVNWEAQLHRVMGRLGENHWLIWTSRKHILERARKQMDLQDSAQHFPQPAEILIDARHLNIRDKALMLYRHAKHGLDSSDLRKLIQRHATNIVHNSAFTPERIRRFIVEVVPGLGLDGVGLHPEELSGKISHEIQNPTERMRKCFRALQPSHQKMLLTLLESDEDSVTIHTLTSIYRQQNNNDGCNPDNILDELREAFVTISDGTQQHVDWIHPSYRDLVIEQLREGGPLKSTFLNGMRLAGIKLALSDCGGPTGNLRFPLITSPKDWETLHGRILEVVTSANVRDCTELLAVLTAAVDVSIGEERPIL